MKRTLSFTIDDEEGTIIIENWPLFSLTELSGIGEHIKLKARCEIINAYNRQFAQERERPSESAPTQEGEGE